MAQTNRTFYSIKNKNKTNINFPLISQSTYFSNFYNNNNRLTSQYHHNTHTNTNTTSNMNAFLERNYTPTIEKFNKSQDTFYAPSPELNSLYYTLKTYYDYVTKQTSAKAEEIAELNKERVSFEKKINEIEMGKEININSKEAISLINASEDPEQIIQKLNDLQEHKMQIQSEYTNESEYAVTIKHMTENVKAEIQKIDEEMLTIEQKLKDINVAKKVIKENKQVRKNEKTKGEALVNAIQNEIDKIHEIVIEQEFKKEKIHLCGLILTF
jgi:chromosome segregation ATPase